MANFLQKRKKWFFERAFYITIADANIGSQKSLHTLFLKYLDHMLVKFEQNQIIQNFELFDKKMVNYFWQNVDAILEDVSVTKTIVWCWTINIKTIIFQCSKNYGSPTRTRVSRLKVAPNMADPISLNEKRPYRYKNYLVTENKREGLVDCGWSNNHLFSFLTCRSW